LAWALTWCGPERDARLCPRDELSPGRDVGLARDASLARDAVRS